MLFIQHLSKYEFNKSYHIVILRMCAVGLYKIGDTFLYKINDEIDEKMYYSDSL